MGTKGTGPQQNLTRTLGTFQLWGIAVGLVISGEYFGWSYGWASAGTLGFVVTSLCVAAMYTAFIFSFTELTCSIPRAGGPFAYARRAFGPTGGYLAGVSFAAVPGMCAAIPFAIWLFLAIEGVAMAAEEAKEPTRSIPIAYVGGIVTLVALALGVMIFAGGVGDWTTLANINDPLPQAMKLVVGGNSGWLHMLVWLGLFGLVASFHAIILGYSRQMFAQAREGFLPAFLARLHPRFATPHWAILCGGAIGIAAILSDRLLAFRGQSLTATLVTLSVFGALTMYIVSMASLFKLRVSEPMMERPYRAPGYPWVPGFALLGALAALALMVYFNALVACIYTGMLVVFYGVFRFGLSYPRTKRQVA